MVPITEGVTHRRSISQLKTYTRCGELYRLERTLDLGEYPAAWTFLGTAFHGAYQEWEESGRSVDFLAIFLQDYDGLIDIARESVPSLSRWGRPPGMSVEKSITHYRNRGIKDIPLYEERCRSADWSVVGIEEEFAIDILPDIQVRGAIDRIQRYPDGRYAIEDIKTGSPDESEPDIRQLLFYGFVAINYLNIPVTHGRYWFSKLDRGGDWVDLRDTTLGEWQTTFRMLNDGIMDEIFLPNPGSKCKLCSVKNYCSLLGSEKV